MAGSIPVASGRIFMSYRREETAYPAGWLYDRLSDRYGGGQVFKDIDSIELGDDFVDRITSAVGSCDVLLALIGDEWLTITDVDGQRRLDDTDDFVRLEIEAALTRNVRVIPILVDGATMPRVDEVPASLARLVRRQALELSPSRFDFDSSRLLQVLDRTLAEVQDDAASTREPAGTAPDRTSELPKASERRDQTEPSSTPSISPEEEGVPGPAARRWLRGWRGAAVVALAAAVLLVAGMQIWGGDRGAETPPNGAPQSPSVQADPGQDAAILLASFEGDTQGWGHAENSTGSTRQASDWSTDGNFSLRIDPTSKGFFGNNSEFGVRDLTGKREVRIDIETRTGPAKTMIAIQLTAGGRSLWCESADDLVAAGTVSLDLGTMRCVNPARGNRPVARPSDLTEVWGVWLYLNEGSFRVDNVRAE